MKPKKNRKRDIGFYVLILVILLATVYLMTSDTQISTAVSYAEVQKLFTEEQVETFVVEDNVIYMQLKEEYEDTGSKEVIHELMDFSVFYYDM